jgi:hypothetical protein
MQTAPAIFDDDIYGLMRAVAADMQTSIALNRAMFRTLAVLSLDCGVAAATALEDEAEHAQRTHAPLQMLEALKHLQAALNSSRHDEKLARRLEEALIAAASGLGDEASPDAA